MQITSGSAQNLLNLNYNLGLYKAGIITANQTPYQQNTEGYADFDDMLEYMIENKASQSDIQKFIKGQADLTALQALNNQNKTADTTANLLKPSQNTGFTYDILMDTNSDGKVTYKEYIEFLMKNSGSSLDNGLYGSAFSKNAMYGLIDISI